MNTPMPMSARWDLLDAAKYRDERETVAALLAAQPLTSQARTTVRSEAAWLVRQARQMKHRQGLVESFLAEFSLSTQEGLALVDRVMGLHVANEQRLVEGLTPAERTQLAGLLRRWGQSLDPGL